METVTEVLVDISGSMKNVFPAVKQVLLHDILPELAFSTHVGIKTFSTVAKRQLSIIAVLPLTRTDSEQIKKVITNLNCSDGHTPIAATIRASVKSLSEYTASNKVIIIITDGAESEGGNFVQEAEKATREGLNCKIHYVGINLNSDAKYQAQEISKITGGTPSFITVNKEGIYDQLSIRENLSPLYQAVRPSKIIQPTEPPRFDSSPNTTKHEEHQAIELVKSEEISEFVAESKANGHSNLSLALIIEQLKELRKEIAELKNERLENLEIGGAEPNEETQKASEEYVYKLLKRKYPDRVKWLNENGESHKDHDFEILEWDQETVEYFIECKGTAKNQTAFLLTKDEWRLFLNNTKNYQIYFVQNSLSTPLHIFIDNLLDWILKGKLVPYSKKQYSVKEDRVTLTIIHTSFD